MHTVIEKKIKEEKDVLNLIILKEKKIILT